MKIYLANRLLSRKLDGYYVHAILALISDDPQLMLELSKSYNISDALTYQVLGPGLTKTNDHPPLWGFLREHSSAQRGAYDYIHKAILTRKSSFSKKCSSVVGENRRPAYSQ